MSLCVVFSRGVFGDGVGYSCADGKRGARVCVVSGGLTPHWALDLVPRGLALHVKRPSRRPAICPGWLTFCHWVRRLLN